MFNNKKTQFALVTDGQWHKSVSAIRALGKNGYTVIVTGDSIFTTGFWSRYTKKRIITKSTSQNEKNFEKNIFSFLQKQKIKPIIFPMEDATLMWLSKNRNNLLNKSYFLIPPEDSLSTAEDKSKTIKKAIELGLSCPVTYAPSTIEEFIEINNSHKLASFVIKPCNGTGSAGIIYDIKLNKEQVIVHWNKFGNLIIQERIPSEGRGLGVALLFDDNENCVAHFVHERLKQYPISGGPSTDRISIINNSLVENSKLLLKSLHWKGIGMVEWKIDINNNNVPKLMEINPRFWGSLELAIRSGVNFPVLYAKASKFEKVAPVLDYKKNIRCRWMIPGDILRYLNDDKKKKENLKEFFTGLPNIAEEWDKFDLRGTIASILCPCFLVLNPKYWKYLKKNR